LVSIKVMDTVIFTVATLGAIGAVLYLYIMSNVKDLKDNWMTYRCNPAYMPLAGFVGQDVFKNFTDCTMKSFQDYSGYVVDPIMSQFSLIGDVVIDINTSMDSMRGMISDTRNGFLGIVGMVFGKIENLMSQFQYIIIRMRTLMARIVGIMMSFIYIFYVGEQTGESVANGPIGQTISFLCFHPDTKIETALHETKSIKDIGLGTSLRNYQTVTSKYTISGKDVPMYKLGNVIVSGEHRVLYQYSYIKVKDHPDAIRDEDCEILVCLNTDTHRILIDGRVFMDFVEDYDDKLLKSAKNKIELYYNGKLDETNTIKTPTKLLPTGFNRETLIPLKKGYSLISNVKIGDELDNGDTVRGIAVHDVHGGYYAEIDLGISSHPCNWIIEDGKIRIAETYGNINKCVDRNLMFNLITESGMYPVMSTTGNRYMVLDEVRTRIPI